MSANTLPTVISPVFDTYDRADGHKVGRGKAGTENARTGMAATHARAADFITQLVVHTDSDLRRVIGSQYIIGQRAQAYGHVLANRPSVSRLGRDLNTLDELS